ncbi:amino acid adenylation domain-containing protein, partial [Streptomyces sp. NPDC057757]|uniref:amino acid adenylation domain-containing protein n=1 Tax=Streptomyces sp. NPDC057757 TaxID=3346241 RepID=UPI0036D0556B
APPPRNTTLPALFSAQAARTPEAVAVTAPDARLAYRALDERANRLAHLLVARGAGPESFVAVALPRGAELVVAVLAVLKAGAAYLPLDPAHPADRLAHQLADAGATLVVVDERHREAADLPARPVTPADLDRPAAAAGPLPAADPDRPAYLIHTSGSTGRPKGVLVRHRNLDNLLAGMAGSPGLGAADRLLATTAVGFDIAALELFLPLRQGARVVVAPDAVTRDPLALAGRLEAHDITVMQATPSQWAQLLDAGWRGKADLRALCGGEPLPGPLVAPLRAACRELWNMYGPTETTVWSSCARVEPGEPVRLGTPTADTRMYVLDAHLAPVPRGVAGELCIAGGGVAAGYRDRPGLTAERFVRDPADGGPMYRTGDLARIDEHGRVEYLGRLDHQVKIRGHRIELGEVENLLERHPDVGKGIAALHRHPERGGELVGYVTLAAGALARRSAALHRAQVAHWEDVWSSVYSGADDADDG